jgi:RHS repeat-associated protein
VGTLLRVTFANGTSMRSLASARQLRQVDQHSAAVSNSFLQTVMQQSFDANGSVTQKVTGQGNLSLTWDARNRLVSASTTGANAVSESYRYDGLGRRIAKTSNGVTTDYLYDGEDIIAEYTGGNWSTPSVRYVHGAGTDEVLARIAYVNGIAQAGEYYAADGLGSVVALARSDGSQLRGTLRDAWGRSVYTAPGGALPLGYGYTGREQDATGLVYYRARYYDAAFGGIQSGAFVSRDPTGLAGGIHGYAYVGNNPVNATDPGGMVARAVSATASNAASYWSSNRPANDGVYRAAGEMLPIVGGAYGAYNTATNPDRSWLDIGSTAAGFVPGGKLVGNSLGALGDFAGVVRHSSNSLDDVARGVKPGGYSVAFETTIAKTGAGTREAHKAAANHDLAGAMSDKEFGQMLSSLGVKPVGGTGTPAGFRWHHAKDRPGTMQLVPEAQHTSGSIFQDMLHPGGSGGFAQWGRGW